MQFSDSIFGRLLKPISRGASTVARHDGNAYDKVFKSWDHLVALVFAQLGGADSLRGLEAVWNANSHHHYHLGVGKLARSTLSDANARRPVAIGRDGALRISIRTSRLEVIRAIPTPCPSLPVYPDNQTSSAVCMSQTCQQATSHVWPK